jgi:hypothetical protein
MRSALTSANWRGCEGALGLNAPSQNHLQIAPSPKAVSTALAISPSISSLYHLDLN